jgi:hypothetical protein
MIANHIHDALGQVRRLQALILEKRKFTGYSGTARMLGGAVAMLGCALMSFFRDSFAAQLAGWVCILVVALLLNYGALLLWFVQLPERKRTLAELSPALDAVPPLAVGAALSAALLLRSYPDLLFGSWMCLYGLAHTTCRNALPKENGFLGLYYIACGMFFLLWPGTTFMNPLPAGVVFLVGEWTGGAIFYRHKIEAMKELSDD